MNDKPHVVVLILDSLRAANMSLHGYHKRTTPAIDALAAQSTVYDQAISPATWTIPAHASLLTGLHVSQHGMNTFSVDRRLNERLVTLPEALRRSGYRTAAFSGNPLFHPSYGLGRGFSTFRTAQDVTTASRRGRLVQRLVTSDSRCARPLGLYLERMAAAEDTLRALFTWLTAGAATNQPTFVLANLLAPHSPWAVPPGTLLRARAFDARYLFRRDYMTLRTGWDCIAHVTTPRPSQLRTWHKLYDAAVMHVDAVLARFLERAMMWSGWSNTILVVTSDHGEMLGERGIVGHCLTMNDNLIRVPLVVRHPDRVGSQRVREIVQIHDLYHSILTWAGVSLAQIPDAQLRTASLDDPLPGRIAITEEDSVASWDTPTRLTALNPSLDITSYPRAQRAARNVTHKYIAYDSEPGEFYDLMVDPQEHHNLIHTDDDRQRDILRSLQDGLRMWESGSEVFPPTVSEDDWGQSPEVEDRLRALGYLS